MCMGQACPRGSTTVATILLLLRLRLLLPQPRPMALPLLRGTPLISLKRLLHQLVLQVRPTAGRVALKPPLPPLALRLRPGVNRPPRSLLPVRPAHRPLRLKPSQVLSKGRAAPPTRRAKPSR